MKTCMNAFQRWTDVAGCLSFDERAEACPGLQLSREDVKEGSSKDVLKSRVNKLAEEVTMDPRTIP